MQDHNHTYYKTWPTAAQVADSYIFDENNAKILLMNLKMLFPDDKLARLIYLNEVKQMLEAGAPEINIWINLFRIAHSRRAPDGVEWEREKNG